MVGQTSDVRSMSGKWIGKAPVPKKNAGLKCPRSFFIFVWKCFGIEVFSRNTICPTLYPVSENEISSTLPNLH